MKTRLKHPSLCLLICLLLAFACTPVMASTAKAPSPPWNIQAKNVTGAVKLTWNPSSGADGYIIFRALREDTSFQTIKQIKDAKTVSYLDKTAVPGVEYFYSVKAYQGSGKNILYSEYDSYGVPICFLAKPEITKLTDTAKGVTLQWSQSVKASGYILYRKLSGDKSYSRLTTVAGDSVLSYTDASVESGKTYTYTVKAYKRHNNLTSYSSVTSAGKSIRHAAGTTSAGSTVYRALVVGEYIYPKSEDNLTGAPNDVKVMQALLKGSKYSVKTLENKSKADILNAIPTAFANADNNDTSLFYYTGHGVTSDVSDPTSNGALAVPNKNIVETLTLQELADALNRIPGRIVVLLDCCGSGAGISSVSVKNGKGSASFTESFHPRAFNQKAVQAFSTRSDSAVSKYGELINKGKFFVITAASTWEKSFEVPVKTASGNTVKGGAFTCGIANGAGFDYGSLEYGGSMPADTNGNNRLTLEEAFVYTYFKASTLSKTYFSAENEQHVMRFPSNSGLVLFKR